MRKRMTRVSESQDYVFSLTQDYMCYGFTTSIPSLFQLYVSRSSITPLIIRLLVSLFSIRLLSEI